MLINFETIRQQADEGWRSIERQSEPGERLAALRKYLRTEARRLQLRHRYGIGGPQIVRARSLIVDRLIEGMARTAAAEGRVGGSGSLAIIALGGYGRQELSPHSDIDLLFLYGGRRRGGPGVSEAILYLLWDSGFTVGHSVRSLSECLGMAKNDLTSRNALLDARLLWGSPELFEELVRRVNEEFNGTRRRLLIDELASERSERYRKFGEVVCMQEPDVKETAGGLRDLHGLLWAARVAGGHRGLPDLEASGEVPDREARALRSAYDFILRVRNDLHFQTGRRTDLLSLDLQLRVARNLGYSDTPVLRASEVFMRDYYLHARRMHRLTELHFQRIVDRTGRPGWLSRAKQVAEKTKLALRTESVGESRRPSFGKEELKLEEFRAMAVSGRTPDPGLADRVQAGLPGVNRQFRSSPAAAAAFLGLLRDRGSAGAVLRQMHELGFLGKYLPEFGRITCLVQHDLYHRYTIDEHILQAIESLDDLTRSDGRGSDRYGQLYLEVKDPAILHLGILMHDIGKGLGGGHTEKGVVIAGRITTRLRLPSEDMAQVCALVRLHLVMAHTSQRRDLSDEKVIEGFAAEVGSLELLKMLTLLTYADLHGVGQGVWNEWKDALLWELYTKTRAVLEPGKQGAGAAARLKEMISERLPGASALDDARSHLELLPEDYARFTAPEVILDHLELARTLRTQLVGLSWKLNGQARCTDLNLCARNRRGLFAAVAGTLTAQGVNILSVHLLTRADGIALESFKVRDADGEPISDAARWEKIGEEIRLALSGQTDVAAAVARRLRTQAQRRRRRSALAPPPATRISWDNRSSARSTILEVRTGDRLGLAYKIASTLAALDLDIGLAKVATEKHRALDIFYITDAAGEKLPDPELPKVEEAIRKALTEGIPA